MKNLILSIRDYVNFAFLCKKNKIQHEFNIVHGNIQITAKSSKLEELGY